MNASRRGSGRLPGFLTVPIVAVLAALVTGGFLLLARGKDPLGAYALLLERGLGTSYGLSETAIHMAPLLIAGAGLIVALRAGVWNIGIDGQVLIGAMLSAVVATRLAGQAPVPLVWIAGGLAGFAGGLAWAVVPALLRARWSLNEIITTLMMNYVALNLTSWLVKGPIRDPALVTPQTTVIPKVDRLPALFGSGVHVGLLVGLIATVVVWVLFRFTMPGFRLDASGMNRRAALHAGLPVTRLAVMALLFSGGMAGLAGANDVLGVSGVFRGNWNPGYGFAVFAVVFLARLQSLWMIPFAWLLSFIAIGGQMMARPFGIPTYYVDVLYGLILLYFAIGAWWERRAGEARASFTDPPSAAETGEMAPYGPEPGETISAGGRV